MGVVDDLKYVLDGAGISQISHITDKLLSIETAGRWRLESKSSEGYGIEEHKEEERGREGKDKGLSTSRNNATRMVKKRYGGYTRAQRRYVLAWRFPVNEENLVTLKTNKAEEAVAGEQSNATDSSLQDRLWSLSARR